MIIAKMFSCKKGVYIVLYADDILLIARPFCLWSWQVTSVCWTWTDWTWRL